MDEVKMIKGTQRRRLEETADIGGSESKKCGTDGIDRAFQLLSYLYQKILVASESNGVILSECNFQKPS